MTPFSSGFPQNECFEEELRRLNALAADMSAIGRGVSPEELIEGEAPLLDRSILGGQFAPCLVGLSTGHPVLAGENRKIATSDLWLLADDGSWARTLSRWYRLGRPGDQSGFDA